MVNTTGVEPFTRTVNLTETDYQNVLYGLELVIGKFNDMVRSGPQVVAHFAERERDKALFLHRRLRRVDSV